jgi:16S rRNA (guanine527-N7)-methyltransferase
MPGARTRGARPEPLTAAGFQSATNVSRETLARLEHYATLLRKWQPAINLVGPGTLDDLWRRHMLDSAQLAPLAAGRRWLDMGSGAGFPGLVLAILGVGGVHLVESDARKAAFLATVARETAASAIVHTSRLEDLQAEPFDVITARALAPLPRLLALAHHLAGPETIFLFPKGQDVDAGLTEAAKCWKFQVDRVPSRTDPRGSILRLRGAYRERQ